MRKFIVPLALLFFMTLSGSTIRLSQQQEVEVGIVLPYSGSFNEWQITFIGNGDPIEFETDDDTFDSEVLGSVPPGEYRIEFNSGYGNSTFDIEAFGPEGSDLVWGVPYATIYDFEIGEDSSIKIDCLSGCY